MIDDIKSKIDNFFTEYDHGLIDFFDLTSKIISLLLLEQNKRIFAITQENSINKEILKNLKKIIH